jgi:hypothetical protein
LIVSAVVLGACGGGSAAEDAATAEVPDAPADARQDPLGLDVGAAVDAAHADARSSMDGGHLDGGAVSPRLPPPNGGLDYQLGGAYIPPAGVTILSRDRLASPTGGFYNVC